MKKRYSSRGVGEKSVKVYETHRGPLVSFIFDKLAANPFINIPVCSLSYIGFLVGHEDQRIKSYIHLMLSEK